MFITVRTSVLFCVEVYAAYMCIVFFAGAYICLQVYEDICVYLVSVFCVRMCVRYSVEVCRTQSDTPLYGYLCGYMVRIIKAKKNSTLN